ncbi:AAC-rich mRNA clone AAC11 protein isoform X3 [Culicoides brevitarsis]|uniref:AAC-rich mRNA clone AAC11 protein isoform X3 n=1 Tax=Culicoides brevitarsis TaxID=469753 RepID=UPI00307C420D
MTVARFNARGRTRLLLFFGVTLCGLIFVIVFHNNQQENDELRQLQLRCEQQLGAIQAQKSRIDKTLDTEKLQLDEARTKQAELIEQLKTSDQKFTALQQECKFSQTNHEDKQKECDKTRLKQATEIDELKQKLKELKKKFDDVTREKEKEISTLKFQLEKHENVEGVDENVVTALRQRNNRLEQELSRAKAKCDGFQQFEASSTSNAIAQQPILSQDDNNNNNDDDGKAVGAVPEYKNSNNNDEGNVLAQPQALKKSSTTTTTESAKAAVRSSSQKSARDSNNLGAPPVMQAPTVKESKSSTPVKKRLPEGVVPVPETSWLNKETQGDTKYPMDDVAPDADAKNADTLNFLIGNEQENLAHEVPDNDFNIDEKKVNPENPNEEKIDNNAEEDTNVYGPNKDVFNTNNKDLLHGNRRTGGNSDTKLRNEVAGDHGKEGEHYPEDDLRIEGQNEEEGDMGDYDDPNVLKQGPAERTK